MATVLSLTLTFMPIPHYPPKYHSHPLLTPTPPAEPAPQTLVLTYQPALYRHATRWWRTRPVKGFFGRVAILRRRSLGLAGHFGLGAPITAIWTEQAAAWGVKNLLIVGWAGGLAPGLVSGQVVLTSQAIRDEGTSYHYAPAAVPARPDEQLFQHLQQLFPAVSGPTWTTDAPYRETAAEIAHFQAQGVLTVEMECSALFVAGQQLGLATAAVLVVADTFQQGIWHRPENPTLCTQRLCEVWDKLEKAHFLTK